MTRSSSESELCSLEDASTYAVWYCNLLEDLGLKDVRPITIFQDNKSTIIMAVQGATFRRTKHLIGRQTFIRERIDNGEVKLSYMPTKDMIADILTKALPAPTFDHLKTKYVWLMSKRPSSPRKNPILYGSKLNLCVHYIIYGIHST